MTTSIRLWSALCLALVAAPAVAEDEAPAAHARGTSKTITLDGDDIRPSRTTLDHGEVVSFVNYSTQPVQVTFTEPGDLERKIRCGLVGAAKEKRAAAPWALFAWQDGKLLANVPPGQFASICSFDPGTYTFTAASVGQRTRQSGAGSVLPAKGQIEVH
jgi:hypothetical protein